MYAVVIPGEDCCSLIGPFRSVDRADEAAARWNREHPYDPMSDDPDPAYVAYMGSYDDAAARG